MLILCFWNCERSGYFTSTSASLSFSTDTVVFDTVITNISTVTKTLKVFNNYDQVLQISRIHLAGGTNSVFRMNVDGIPTRDIHDVEILEKDSLYIFIEATLNSNEQDSILLIQDSIVFEFNSNVQDVDLLAWGQDVHFLDGETIKTETWTSEKPYLIYNSILLDSNETLSIDAGVTIYFHKGSRMYVSGTIIANGALENPISFRGDRLDYYLNGIPYNEIPDQWEGIWFRASSNNNMLDYCNIRNAKMGIQLGVLGENEQSDIVLKNCKVDNHSYASVFAINSILHAENCVISNAGTYTAALVAGGNYNFIHCTLPNYFTHLSRSSPGFVFTNNITYLNETFENDLELYVGNSIIYGSQPNEIGIGIKSNPIFEYKFENCLIRQDEGFPKTDTSGRFLNVVFSHNPRFISTELYKYNFMLDTLSPAKDIGSIALGQIVPLDILQNSRLSDFAPDLGAFERIDQ